MVTRQPRKQRLRLHTRPMHVAAKAIRAHLSEALLLKYKRRSVTLRVGDTVRVLRGDYRGHTGKVVTVDHSTGRVTVEGVTVRKSDATEVSKPVFPSVLLATKLDLADRRRRADLGAPEEAPAAAAEPEPAPPAGSESKKPAAESRAEEA